jgi:hypothetical protein
MNFKEEDLQRALKEGIISAEVYDKLFKYLVISAKSKKVEHNSNTAETDNFDSLFNIENFLYYFGGFIIITTMGWFLALNAASFGYGGLFVTSILYFLFFVGIGNYLWGKDKKTPGGLLYVCAVSIVPLAVWAFESLIGIMPKELARYNDFHIRVRSGYISMEVATIIVGYVFLKFRKFSLLTLPICYAMWYLSMDIVPLLLGQGFIAPTWVMKNFASCIFALIMLFFAVRLDNYKQSSEDYSYWLYIFGSSMLWGTAISIIIQNSWYNEFAYFLAALFSFVYMLVSILIKRKVFMFWGALGIWSYLGHLAYKVFANSFLFPFVLVVFGLLIIFFGIGYSKYCKTLEVKLRSFFGMSISY